MATEENLNNTDPVVSTDTPQTSENTQNGAQGSDFQSTTSPEKVDPSTDVSVLQTGEPVNRTASPVDTSVNVAPYAFGGVLLAIIVAGVVLVMRVKDFSSGTSGASLLKSEADTPSVSARSAKKSSAKKTATARKTTAKKTTKKRPAASRKKRR